MKVRYDYVEAEKQGEYYILDNYAFLNYTPKHVQDRAKSTYSRSEAENIVTALNFFDPKDWMDK